MKRSECFKLMGSMIEDQLFVTTMTGSSWFWRQEAKDHEGNIFLSVMGGGASVGFGLAKALPHRKVIVFESDGSTLMDLAGLTSIGLYKPNNLKVFVFDDGMYSVGIISRPTTTTEVTDLEVMARGAGIETATTVRDIDQFADQAKAAFQGDGLQYVVTKVERERELFDLPKPTMDHLENKYRFMRYIEKTENIKVFRELW